MAADDPHHVCAAADWCRPSELAPPRTADAAADAPRGIECAVDYGGLELLEGIRVKAEARSQKSEVKVKSTKSKVRGRRDAPFSPSLRSVTSGSSSVPSVPVKSALELAPQVLVRDLMMELHF